MIASKSIAGSVLTKALVELYQIKDAPQPDRDNAFVTLTYRFRSDVLKKCEILCHNYGHDINVAETIAFRTFESYARKGKFDEAKGKGKTYDESFLLYLLRIAERELINYYRENERKKKNPYDGTEQIYYELPETPAKQKIPLEKEIELNAINNLSKSHRTIYLTYKVHQRQGFKMPRKLLISMREQLGLKQDTVNAYLKEARDVVNKAIDTYHLTEKIRNNGK
jgi:DNA-directed RNA polymerase specialized sigma24 family protein